MYVINEVEGTIELSYKLHVSSKDYPGRATYKSYLPELAGMQLIKWTLQSHPNHITFRKTKIYNLTT